MKRNLQLSETLLSRVFLVLILLLLIFIGFTLSDGIMKEDIEIQTLVDQKYEEGGGVVELPPGTILVEKTIILKTGVHLKGDDTGKTTLKYKINDNHSLNDMKILEAESGSSNIKISQIIFDGDKQHRKKFIDDPNAHTISLPFTHNFEITNNTIINSAGASIVLYNSENGVVKNNTIKNSGSNGILGLQATRNIKVIDNVVENIDFQNGIYFSYQDGKASENILIEGNTVKNAGDFGIEVGHNVKSGDEPHQGIEIRKNKVIDSQNAGIAFRTVSNGIIENNYVEGYGETGGYGADGLFIEGGFNKVFDIKVLKNVVVQKYDSGDANGIYVTGIDGITIQGNNVQKSRGRGLFVQASKIGETTEDFPNGLREYQRVNIIDNTFSKNKIDGIHLQGTASTDNVIKHNIVSENNGIGILIANLHTSTGLLIENNKITNNSKIGIEVYQQEDFQILDNRLTNNAVNKFDEIGYSIRVVSTTDGLLKGNEINNKSKDQLLTDHIIIESSSNVFMETN